jgi:hypothetical protein
VYNWDELWIAQYQARLLIADLPKRGLAATRPANLTFFRNPHHRNSNKNLNLSNASNSIAATKTRIYVINHSGLSTDRVVECDSSLEVEINTHGSIQNTNFTFYLNSVPAGAAGNKYMANGKRHYYMVFAMESEAHSGGGLTWTHADFRMWYNLDLSFPEPATYFDLRSHLPDLLAKPVVEFEAKTSSADIVWVLSNCNAYNRRESFVRKLMNAMKVDSYGGCLHNRDGHTMKRMAGNIELYSKYKFVLTIENSNCEDYVTEKLVFAVASGSIPIVAGRDNKPNYDRYMPRDSYISLRN